jgi:transcriptional regulator
MYLPTHFKEDRHEILTSFIEEYPLGLLITIENDAAQANHLPWSLSGNLLQAHIPKVNPLYKFLQTHENLEVLIIFQGPHAYITPSWYPSKKETGKVVPTWNYSVVHVRGKLNLRDDRQWLQHQLNQLTNANEKKRNSEWQMSDAPEDYTQSMMNVLVGLELEIQSIEGKFKLSQNRLEQDRLAVIDHLSTSQKSEDVQVAELTKKLLKK